MSLGGGDEGSSHKQRKINYVFLDKNIIGHGHHTFNHHNLLSMNNHNCPADTLKYWFGVTF